MKQATIATWVVGLTVVLAAPASAQEWAGSYELEGRHEVLGAFDGRLEVSEEGAGGFTVTETLRLQDGREVVRRGAARAVEGGLEADLGGDGISSTIEGSGQGTRRLRLRLDGDQVVVSGRDADGASSARGRRARPSLSDRLAEKGKHLLALAKREVREEVTDRAREGARLDQEFGLHRYLHVGVTTAGRALAPQALTPAMSASTGPRQVWLVTEVAGGLRAPFNTTIPLGDATVSVGLEPGARVRYEVTDRYDLPEGITDGDALARGLKDLAARSFDLPLDANEALAMTPGARRVLEGQASVALSGNLSIGHEVANIEGILRIGASARVGGFWRLQGDVRFEVERLSGKGARLRVTQGRRTHREGSADLILGVATDEAALARELAPVLEYVDVAVLRDAASDAITGEVADRARDVIRFELRGTAGRVTEDEVDVAYRFDLSRDAARAAYDRAIRGDLTAADAAAETPGSGVLREYRVLDVETRTYRSGDLVLSLLLRAGARRTVTWTDLSIQDESGVSRFELFRFTRERSLELFGRERRRAMELDVIRRAAPDGAVTRALRWSLDVLDPTTTEREARELRRALAGWGLDASSSLPDPESKPFRSRYGKTRTRLTVEVAEAGVAAALAASEAALFEAYVGAWAQIHGELPLWATEEGRDRIDEARHDGSVQDHDQERLQLWHAEKFVKGVRALATSPDLRERARRLESLAKGAGYDLYVISALVGLAPRDTIRVTGAIEGERIAVGDEATGVLYAPLVVPDPRR